MKKLVLITMLMSSAAHAQGARGCVYYEGKCLEVIQGTPSSSPMQGYYPGCGEDSYPCVQRAAPVCPSKDEPPQCHVGKK